MGLPPYSPKRIQLAPSLTVSKEEKVDVDILVIVLVALFRKDVNRMDLLEVLFQWRIQHLQARAHPMWMYIVLNDPTHVHPEEIGAEESKTSLRP